MSDRVIVDASVQPYPETQGDLREYLPSSHKLRRIVDIPGAWYQAPDGDYHESSYPDDWPNTWPGSDPEKVAHDLFDERGIDIAILNPLTRGNLPDYLLNSELCASTNRWLIQRWLTDGNAHGRFRGTIRVNPQDVPNAVREIEHWADEPYMVQVGVPMQSLEPYGKPQFYPIWEAAAAHGLPVAVHINAGNGIDRAPTLAGHCRTYAQYALMMPLNYFIHLATLIIEGAFERYPNLVFVFQDGGIDMLTSLIWRLDMLWVSTRDQTPWVTKYPHEYLARHVRFTTSALDGPTDPDDAVEWLDFNDKAHLYMFGSQYPHWGLVGPQDTATGLTHEARERLLWRNANSVYRLGLDAAAVK